MTLVRTRRRLQLRVGHSTLCRSDTLVAESGARPAAGYGGLWTVSKAALWLGVSKIVARRTLRTVTAATGLLQYQPRLREEPVALLATV
jgi:hypothetical protein